jgi:hypothetical protein
MGLPSDRFPARWPRNGHGAGIAGSTADHPPGWSVRAATWCRLRIILGCEFADLLAGPGVVPEQEGVAEAGPIPDPLEAVLRPAWPLLSNAIETSAYIRALARKGGTGAHTCGIFATSDSRITNEEDCMGKCPEKILSLPTRRREYFPIQPVERTAREARLRNL